MFNTPNYSYPWNNNNYPYTQINTSQPQQVQMQLNSIIWVQGEAGAKSYNNIGAGQSVILMDSENEGIFYIKTIDASGIPMPLRTFEYVEQTPQKQKNIPNNEYITRKEFEKRLSELKNAKQSISTAQ